MLRRGIRRVFDDTKSQERRRRRFLPRFDELESRVLLTDATVSAYFLANAGEPNTTGGMRLLRSGGDMSQPLTVNYTITGTATPDGDYTGIGDSYTFAAFLGMKDISIDVIDDSLIEGAETVVLTLESGTGYVPDEDHKSATVTISDDETGQGSLPPPNPCPNT